VSAEICYKRPMRRPPSLAALALAAALLPAPAPAVDLADGKLSIHGDGQWAYRRTAGDNGYLEGTPEGNYDTAMFDLVLTARPSEDLVISAQLGFEPDDTGAEWVFAEWRFSEALRLKVGKIQQPIGNFNELRFAGTTRAFFDLPESLYGPGNILAHAVLGVAVTGQAALAGGWTVAWDAYAGALRLAELETYSGLVDPTGAPVVADEQQVRDVLGARLSVTTPGDLTLRLSGYGGQAKAESTSTKGFYAYGASLQYRDDRLWLSAEGFGSIEVDSETTWSGYAMAGWFLTEQLQAAVRVEVARTRLPGLGARSPLQRHADWALGLNWWFTPGMVVKASFQDVTGNRFAFPEEASDLELVSDPPSERTQLVVLGAQFSF
jgi:hypothetical protein